MEPELINGNVRAACPDCNGAISTFEFMTNHGGEFGGVHVSGGHTLRDMRFTELLYRVVRCAGCGRGGLAEIHYDHNPNHGYLEDFYPYSIKTAPIPDLVPEGIVSEYREAELCASVGAWRAASALLRSSLEKTLEANGFKKGNLYNRIEAAAKVGVITKSRANKAHDDIRVLGNDVLHDEWKEITSEEVSLSHKYTQRILEDLYDDREETLALLAEAGIELVDVTGEETDEAPSE